MITERMELLPGVWLNMVQSDRFKTGCFSINFVRPLSAEEVTENALIPSVLLRGCEAYPDMLAISNRLDELYGAGIGTLIRKKGEVHLVGLYADFLEDCFAENEPVFVRMMDFVHDLLFHPVKENGGFVAAFVENEAWNLKNTIAAKINDKRSYAISRLLKHMCADETYAVPRLGYEKALESVDPCGLYQRWQSILATSPIEIFYMGRQPRRTVVDTVCSLLRELPRESLVSASTNLVYKSRPVQYVDEAMDVTQGKLTMGLRTPITVHDPRYPAMLLMNTIFGGGMTSKLFLQIREEQSLCYYASSSLDKFKGIMLIDAGISFESYEIAKDGILHQLELCKQGEITEEELETARNYLISAFRTGQDSPGRLDDYAVGQAVNGLSGTMDDLAEQVSAVTMEQVVEAANTLQLDTVYFLKGAEV